jgi:nicotinamide-nucleotide amidase
MRAEVLSIGTELLLGEIVDTNSAWLSARLADAGWDVYWSGRVGDNLERVVEALELALRRSDIVVTSGGLGSTDDDLTRSAVARIVGEEPAIDPRLEAHLRDWFARANLAWQDLMLKQATRIPSAVSLPNRVGTAPGWLVPVRDRFIVTLPGPPRELQAMWIEQAEPRLPKAGGFLLRHSFKTWGIGEGRVFELLGALVKPANPSVATYAKRDGVHVRVAAKAANPVEAASLAGPVIEEVRERLAGSVWGEGEDTLVGQICEVLRGRGHRLSTVESITGGLIAHEITSVAGVSDVYAGGAVAYDPAVKVRIGVPSETVERFGVVSEETARAMAEACTAWFETEYAIATTGVAGPTDLEGKPPGTVWMAIRGPGGTAARRLASSSRSRAQIQERSTFAALGQLWRALNEGTA